VEALVPPAQLEGGAWRSDRVAPRERGGQRPRGPLPWPIFPDLMGPPIELPERAEATGAQPGNAAPELLGPAEAAGRGKGRSRPQLHTKPPRLSPEAFHCKQALGEGLGHDQNAGWAISHRLGPERGPAGGATSRTEMDLPLLLQSSPSPSPTGADRGDSGRKP